ncbi:hypothetical protein O3M35_009597 [Rhynocoris fuscipes]|uniref:Uncharacterized protein n=1 Tax=Rhynocoris fuscipes TaxID=488301 RepID=A0AAW1D8V7_9HEMI
MWLGVLTLYGEETLYEANIRKSLENYHVIFTRLRSYINPLTGSTLMPIKVRFHQRIHSANMVEVRK